MRARLSQPEPVFLFKNPGFIEEVVGHTQTVAELLHCVALPRVLLRPNAARAPYAGVEVASNEAQGLYILRRDLEQGGIQRFVTVSAVVSAEISKSSDWGGLRKRMR